MQNPYKNLFLDTFLTLWTDFQNVCGTILGQKEY